MAPIFILTNFYVWPGLVWSGRGLTTVAAIILTGEPVRLPNFVSALMSPPAEPFIKIA